MQIKDSRFHKCWKIEEKNGFKKITLGDSKKEKDSSYSNWNWFDVTLVGNAKNIDIAEGDTITIISGLCNKRKYQEKYYDDIVIFDFEVTGRVEKKEETSGLDSFVEYDDQSDLPF